MVMNDTPKIIAFYLPQFHEINENNIWWGKGFTEWTNTKKAIKYYPWQLQPRTPLNKNYYDLLNSETQVWQSDLALKYGVSGFCYYHYWFDGKLLLEKPAENMLKNRKVKIPFCFSWANEPWTRAWDGGKNEILINQTYGDNYAWKKHIEYLTPFFLDDRYIKINNKPLFLIYRTSSIPSLESMISYFDKYLKQIGFSGIYFVETLNSYQAECCSSLSEAVVEFEPMLTLRLNKFLFFNKKINTILRRDRLHSIKYEKVWRLIVRGEKLIQQKKYS